MPQYEAIVLSTGNEGVAEVIVQPTNKGIPGVSAQINQRVCHCASDGSAVKISAINRVGADVGDCVFVTHDASLFIKNAVALLGIPGIALAVGIALAAVLTRGFTTYLTGGLFAGLGLLGSGIALGVFAFRRMSSDGQFLIGQILQKKGYRAGISHGVQSFTQRDNAECKGCTRIGS